jgi:cysteine desulfurase / selenocysteine lyase
MSRNHKFCNYRKLIVGLEKEVPLKDGGRAVGINFDNAATTPPFTSVLKEIVKFSPWYSSVHRGTGYKSQLSSKIYDEAREIVLDFVKADRSKYTVIFVKNTTEGINKLSYRLITDKESVVISTCMEHHSNDLPWRDKCQVEYVEVDKKGMLCMEDLEFKLRMNKGKVKLVTVTGASNVTGYVNDIHNIARLAHEYGAKILVDGAQLVPHVEVDMKPCDSEEHIDYLVFSAHKMYAPFGIGAIVGPKECFQYGAPEYKGGGTVQLVTRDFVDWDEPPNKEEAGSPNIIGVVALITAIQELKRLGMKNLESQEIALTDYALKRMKKLPYVKLYGATDENSRRVGIIPFNIPGIPHEVIAKALSEDAGIAVRSGCFCAHPYVQRLLDISKNEMEMYRSNRNLTKPGLVRISFGLYNNINEVDILINRLNKIIANKDFTNKLNI